MPTYQQRAQAHADALLGKVATLAQINRLGEGYAEREGRLAQYQTMTNAQKAEVLVRHARRYGVDAVKHRDERSASDTARASAATAVDVEFAE